MFISSFCSKSLVSVLVSFSSLLFPYIFSFMSPCIAISYSFILWPYSIISLSILINSVLNLHLIGWLSPHCLVCLFFFWSFVLFFHLGHISFPQLACYIVRGRALGIHQNGATCITALWCCMWETSQRGNNVSCLALTLLSVMSPITHKQVAPFWCWFQVGGFVYILGFCGPLLWTLLWDCEFFLLPQHPQIFTARGSEALFCPCWDPGLCALSHFQVVPPGLSACKCETTWSGSCCLAECPLYPTYPSLPLLPVWINVPPLTPWLLDFHTVQFSGSSGCFLF